MKRRGLVGSLVTVIAVAVIGLVATLLAGWSPQLGLDLQGGASVVLQPDGEVREGTLDAAVDIIRNRVDGLGVAEPEVTRNGDTIIVALPGVKDQDRALEIVGQTAELRFRYVLQELGPPVTAEPATTTTAVPGDTTVPGETTIAGATTVPGETTVAGTTTAAPTDTTVPATPATTAAADTTIAGDALGPSAGPGAAPALPAQTDTTQPPAPDTTAPTETTAAGDTTVAPETTAPPTTQVGVPAEPIITVPPPPEPEVDENGITPPEQDLPDAQVVLPEKDGSEIINRLLLGPTFLLGSAVSSADARLNQSGTAWSVEVQLKGADAATFDQAAQLCFSGSEQCPPTGVSDGGGAGGRLAIVLDGVVQSAPVVNSPTFNGEVNISGDFTEREAKNLALVLRYGSLPVKLVPQEVRTVSATIGKDSLQAGIIAGLIGVALVLAFMVFYYRWLGLVVLAGIVVSSALLWTVISWLGEQRGLSLTLAGATGIIVSIGVTVDSYVVYFERLKDEIRGGRTLRGSAERGFKSAYRTIVAADLVSLIGAALLWYLTVGAVRGFAFFLGVSAVLDMIVAYFFTRPLVILLARSSRLRNREVLGVRSGEGLAIAGGAR